jgi:hypothetical protein
MMMTTTRARCKFLTLLTLLAIVVPTTVALTGSAATAEAACANSWGSLDKAAGDLGPGPLVASRAGQHPCYDSLVFEFNGPADGYRVGYAGEVYSEGQGLPLSAGAGRFGALLGIHLLEPAYDVNGRPTFSSATPDVTGYQTFRGVAWGGSFEGHTTFALGVRARLPFEVLVLPGPGSHTRIVVNVAHRGVT